MKNFKIILHTISLVLITSCSYSQQGYYVDKDSRIKQYQPEMVAFLTENHQFGNKESSSKKENYMSMFVYKTVELTLWSDRPTKSGILLVKFGSLADHATHYWALLEANSKLFFLNTDKPTKELINYMNTNKYSKEHQYIILYTLELYRPYESSGGDVLLLEPIR